jgi:CMP-N-acetylneuraminic acid synthetase
MRQQSKIKVLGIIPARGGSKTIPGKNIAPLAGKPLIYYTIDAANKATLLDACIVSTDDPKIAEVAKSYGADVPFLRPKKLARDNSPDIDFLKHAILWLEKHRGWNPEIVLNLRPTSPLRTSKDIDAVIDLMIKTRCDSVRTLCSPYPHNPFKMWYFHHPKSTKIKPLLPTKHYERLGTDVPRQLLPTAYWQNGSVDATRVKFIKQGIVYGPDIRGIVIDDERSMDIDELEDLKRAEIIMKKLGLF